MLQSGGEGNEGLGEGSRGLGDGISGEVGLERLVCNKKLELVNWKKLNPGSAI